MSEKFRQYNLIETLSKKYSHTTYLASPIDEPERRVVLTIFNSSLFCFPPERESLLQKAQRIKQLQHPYLVSLLETGIEKEQPFVVREYLPHGSLRSDLKKISPKRLLLRDALSIVLQVGEALVYTHEHNIIHGNVKPENILLEGNGQALLADFHLVSRKDALVRDQASEKYAFCYMAPEQFAGVCDARSDQYSLGCVAYELITGQVPFPPQTLISMMGRPNNGQLAPLSESVVDLPLSLEAAVLKALAQDPEERFFDFSLFLEVVKSVLLPPPVFPLACAAHSSKNRVGDHPVQSREARIISSSIINHAVLPNSMPQPPELARVSNSVKVGTAGSTAVSQSLDPSEQSNLRETQRINLSDDRYKHTSSTAQASMQMVSLSASLEDALQFPRFPFSLSGQACPIDGTESEKEEEDSLVANPFVQEEDSLVANPFVQEEDSLVANPFAQEEDSLVANPFAQEEDSLVANPFVQEEDSLVANPFAQEEEDDDDLLIAKYPVQEKEEDEWPVVVSASAHDVPDEERIMSHDGGGPRSVRPRRGKSKGLGVVLLVSGLMALIVYVFLPMVRAASNTSPQVANKEQVAVPQVTRISTGPNPARVVIVPTARPSVQATASTLRSVPQSKNIAPSHVGSNSLPPTQASASASAPSSAPTSAPTPTPTPVPTPTPTPTVTSAPTTYEAASSQNTLAGGAAVISCPTCPGGYRVGYLGVQNGGNGTLTFNNVNENSTGSYTLALYYSNGNSYDEYLDISVNGGTAIVFDGSPTGSFSTVAAANIAVNLNAGSNTIKFYNSQAIAPDVNKIVV